MNTSIDEIVAKLKSDIVNFLEESNCRIDTAETYFSEKIKQYVLDCLALYYERMDEEIVADKAGRKEEGLTVERRNESRQVLTTMGMLEFKRTYFRKKLGGYVHPVDEIAGVEAYERVSGGTCLALVNASKEMSYWNSSKSVTNGYVSRQTVMNKIRECEADTLEKVQQKRVPVLHIDADEDHIKLQDGTSRIVPLVSVYEGVGHVGKRGYCKNVFHISRFNVKPEELWNIVLDEIINRYDISETKIYIHGDGASWIMSGLEYFPGAEFVLDKHHKNKEILAAIGAKNKKQEDRLRTALNEGNLDVIREIEEQLVNRNPEREGKIRKSITYLVNHINGITICSKDPEANNGGATEPHVSNVLSRRLSSRPMAWSESTLESFVPIISSKHFHLKQEGNAEPLKVVTKAAQRVKNKIVKNSLGLPHPDMTMHFGYQGGRRSSSYIMFRSFSMLPGSF